MAPYLKSLGSDKHDLIKSLEEKNAKEIEAIDAKLKTAEENEGDSEISELLRQKAMYYVRIGDKVGSRQEGQLMAGEVDSGLGDCLGEDRWTGRSDRFGSVERQGWTVLFGYAAGHGQHHKSAGVSHRRFSANLSLIDSGGDWDRRNRLKVYRALHKLSVRDFKEASELFIDSLSTFTATELMEYEEFVALTVLAAGVGCDRKGIKTKVSEIFDHAHIDLG